MDIPSDRIAPLENVQASDVEQLLGTVETEAAVLREQIQRQLGEKQKGS